MSEHVKEVLLQLSEQLGMATEQVFSLYTQAQTALAIKTAIVMIPTLAVGVWCAKRVYSESDDKEFGALIALYAALFGAGLTFALLEFTVGDIVMRLLAPEYMAAEQLLGKLTRVSQ